MPRKKQTSTQVDSDTLVRLKQSGVESVVLDCRLAYNEANQILTHYLSKMQGDRIYPHFLPTQASGRWSCTDPPVTNFPKDIRDTVWPDPGTFWVDFDLDAIEGKIVAGLSGDTADIEAFNLDYDIHTLTACRMYGMPEPPIKTKACHQAPECEDWRHAWKPVWEGGDDRRRHLAKTARYGLFYAPDERGILNAKDVEKLNLSREALLDVGKRFLTSKPALRAWQRQTWGRVLEQREARTFLGRRRKLFVTGKDLKQWRGRKIPPECAREGLNHEVQGSVADMMNDIIIKVFTRWPEASLKQQRHDGLAASFPTHIEPWPEIKAMVEQSWELVPGRYITSTAEWYRIDSDGKKVKLT